MDNGVKNSAGARDGIIDFGRYTTEQLFELQLSIDSERFPLNHARLVEELKRRESARASDPSTDNRYDVQFSRSTGFWAWVQAKRRRQWFYGNGSLEIDSTGITLRGWQRTWLGMPAQGERHVALESIRNVGCDHTTVMIQFGRRWGSDGKQEFDCGSAAAAESLCARLPLGQDATFQREWQQMREFHRALYAPRNYPWAATAMVTINVLTFVAFVIWTKSWPAVLPQFLTIWGSNYGPLTLGGQWWRLLSSLFLHLSLLHLFLNMWVLWNVGRLAERLFGHGVFLLLYFFTGVIAGLVTIAWDPSLNVVGASGAIFGVLGAVLASIIRPSHRTPTAFIRSHWLSLLLFTLFNLLSGFMQIGIANAAHVGGLVSGVLLGGVVAIPRHDIEHRYRRRQIFGATGAAVAILLIAFVLTPGLGGPIAPLQHYWKSRQWFIVGEANSLREWQSLLFRSQSGSISDDDLARAFETQILPFWKSASDRTAPEKSLSANEQAIAKDVHAYAMGRRDWAEALVDAVRSRSPSAASNMQFYAQKVSNLTAHMERWTMEESANLVSRSLVRSALVSRVRRTLFPAPACVRSQLLGFSTSPADLNGDGPKHRELIACSAQAAFRLGDFRALEESFTKYSPEYADPADGGSDRYAIEAGLENLFRYGGLSPPEILAAVASWRHQYPKSVLPDVIEASAFVEWGWMARGNGYATSVTQQQMMLFEYRNAMAEGVLEDIESRSVEEPLWYTLSVQVRLNLSKTRGDVRGAFDDGIAKFPNFFPLYRAEMRALMPRWGGSYQKVDDLIGEAASVGNSAAGAKMYARLYWSYASLEGDDVDIFADSPARWPRVAEGFDLMLRQYPDSDYLLNGYAYMACRAGDSEKYHALRASLKYRLSSTAWSNRYSVAECDRKYAANGA